MKNFFIILFTLAIDIYGAEWCGYCTKAKLLLESKNIKYKFHDVDDPAENSKMRERLGIPAYGRVQVPQIFINKKHIGGYSDLYKLEKYGQLDKMIKSK